MTKSISFQQLFLNQIVIPNKLLITYKELGLNEKDVVVILQIHRFLIQGKEFPTPAEIASFLTIDEQECSLVLRKLIQKQLLVIESKLNDKQQLSEAYCLDPLWKKLFQEVESTEDEEHVGTLFLLFEQEFGRPLSPFEIETINSWLDDDQILPALIKAALRESVLMGKLNFKYIDRILRDWKRKGINTVEQAREEAQNFRNHQTQEQKQQTTKRDTTFYYNWLEDGE